MSTITIRYGSVYSRTSAIFNKVIGEGAINWPALALARFLLSFVVVAAHILGFVDTPGPFSWFNRFNAFNAILGFLLISGLSIGKSIQQDPQGYYRRRAQRIYPVYLASIALQYIVLQEGFGWKLLLILLANIFFFNQVVTDTSYVGPAWTLTLEVWLYALAPLFLRLSFKVLLALTLASFGSYIAYTCARTLVHAPYYAEVSYGLNLVFLSFIWVAGFMLALFKKKQKKISFLIAALLFTHWASTFAIQLAYRVKNNQLSTTNIREDLTNFTMEAICLGLVFYVVIANRHIPPFSAVTKRAVNLLGNISYPLYLSHLTVLILCRNLAIHHWALLAVSCLVVAALIYWIFDFYSKKRVA